MNDLKLRKNIGHTVKTWEYSVTCIYRTEKSKNINLNSKQYKKLRFLLKNFKSQEYHKNQ